MRSKRPFLKPWMFLKSLLRSAWITRSYFRLDPALDLAEIVRYYEAVDDHREHERKREDHDED
jgi:hypothetical protein